MPMVPFVSLPDSARIWVFASDRALRGAPADTMLAEVDRFLGEWKAHGVPLRCAREWRDDRFLAIGVDVTAENASGCSIDGLFRTFQELQREIGAQLIGGGRVFYRGDAGIETATREEFVEHVKRGHVKGETPVFDTTITDARTWRQKFEQPASLAWTQRYFQEGLPRTTA
ncbi:MAG TPA: hypothetical protein VN706_25640 [Gemmatimonadaceae bacterium]|nr:hypothetical protein [Gemmatimonadaceae bacterium]